MKNNKKSEKKITFTSLSSNDRKELLEFLKLKNKFQDLDEEIKNIGIRNLTRILQEEIQIPISIFNERLSVLETICKYLKENLNFSNKKISLFLNKSSKSVWQAISNARKKYPDALVAIPTQQTIPILIFRERKSVLESITIFLKEDLNLTYHEIALLLKRDDRTIWTVYNRRVRKNHE